MKYIIVCTLGRSGSTLLQGLLNGASGCCIRGENGNFLLGLYQSYRAICHAKSNSDEAVLPTHPWYGGYSFSPDRFIADARKTFEDQLAFPKGTTVAGFKEIRWTPADLGDVSLDEYMHFLILLLGDVKFVFLTRDIQDIYESQKRAWLNADDMDFDTFSESASHFYKTVRSIDLPIYEIDYSEITHISDKMINMFEFLNIDFDEERIASILATEHSYANARHYAANH
ncbi:MULTISPECIES: sulfotransferase [Methylobacterium]|uniref:sulfotransferase n=1 Tax=Methylobacterium TaxID=407 RepID=UPI0013EB4902|nr:sulfotransferase [Methylobacterium sp. DB0501]NGM34805.1 sulfotransferase [Methylobacterium sp. DB0501]